MSQTTRAVTDRLAQLPLPPGSRLPSVVHSALFPYRHRITPLMRKRYGDIIAVSVLAGPQSCSAIPN